MKKNSNVEDYITELASIIHKEEKLETLKNAIEQLFYEILKNYPYLKLPSFSTIPTKSLEFSVWYQDPNAITETLLIEQNSFAAYIWKCDDQKWYLDDLYSDRCEIASQLIESMPVFHSIPENPKEVQHLLEIGIMHFDAILFPKFSERKPEDCREVLTWDERFLLVGTQLNNLRIYSYDEWKALIHRENIYLAKDD
ncbi:hypothetical protein [Acinetobacter sp. NIPH 2699]|uniref:hypothetical protein n=1 Tax=Acinetobacter sp. NIPH 2699 TaxID=2923433 RepID=UPI001F4B3790|nr:hypothetical protein [Acinetobacter sp. NIPH 2699]MCH7336770.1 hypothetical protein [Acinetobacter sp. NIPH 2699]